VPVAALWFLLNFSAAWDDAGWAADRFDTIKGKYDTTGIFYDEDGEPHEFSSGDEKGADAERARKVLRAVGAASDGTGSYPAATHVEVKVAALMREAGLKTGLLIINHEDGPCAGGAGLSCREVVSSVLAPGTTLRVWFPTSDGPMDHLDFQGK
jgi:hypothetical protein